MELTLGQMMSLVTRLNQGRTDYATSELSEAVNLALSELCERSPMRSLESTVVSSTTSGTSNITLPATLNYPVFVSNLSLGEGAKGKHLDPADVSEVDSGSTYVGVPYKYAIYRDQMLLWPSADSTYSIQIRFQEKVPTLTSSASTAVIDVRWHPGLAYRAAAIAAALRNDVDGEAINQARYLGFAGSSPQDQQVRQRGRPMQFKPTWRRS